MEHCIVTTYENNKINHYIEYNNGKKIQLEYCENYKIYKDDNYIYYLENYNIQKIFDINNKCYIKSKLKMYITYNNYLNNILKKQKVLSKTNT